jgi:hypothetical protein
MKISFYIIIFFGVLYNGNAQCLPTVTNNDNNNPQCSDQWTPTYSSGVIKINIYLMVLDTNTYTFSTVGETLDDTYLSLYDSSGTLLASNDDYTACHCKQSTIEFSPKDLNVMSNCYIILSKPNCDPLVLKTKIKYNVRNDSNTEPVITYPPISLTLCGETQVQFTSSNAIPNSWVSLDPAIATIDSNSGLATFIKEGIAKIQLSGNLSCVVVNNYLVHIATKTSIITSN